MKTNAKSEMLSLLNMKGIKCASIQIEDRQITLRVGFSNDEYEKFIEDLDFDYDSGYGHQYLFGNVWFIDGTWAERGEYDGSEWWSHKSCPTIPKELIDNE